MSAAWIFDDTITPRWAIAMETRINKKLEKIMGLKDDLDAVLTQLGKAKTEILAKLADLEAKVAAGQDVAQEIADLKLMAQSMDDVVPDAEPPA